MITLSNTKTILYSAWFCPFAQRVWSALNEFGVDFTLVESLGFDENEAYVKHPDLVRHNPKGLVPTLVQKVENEQQQEEEEHVYCDSLTILKGLYATTGMPDDELEQTYETACRWNRNLCSTFYTVMIKQDSQEAWSEMKEGLYEFASHIDNGLYYDSRPTPGLIDFCVFPFVHRLYLLDYYKHYRLLEDTETHRKAKAKLESWRKLMESRPSVAATLADPERLIPVYARYADGSAQSKVADAVRGGRFAHDV